MSMDEQGTDLMSAAIFDDRACFLGEGPFWHPERGQLFWFDILAGRMLSRDASGPLEWRFGECASAAGWIDAGTLAVSTETGLRRFDIASGAHEPLAVVNADPGLRCNDGRTDPMGGMWISLMGKRAEAGAGSIWRWQRGRLECLHRDITIPNAICFAPDGRRAWFADTKRGLMFTQSLDAEGWPDAPAELWHDFGPEGLNPDGAVTDAEGRIWLAQWGAGRVVCLDAGARELAVAAVGGRHSSCPVFGGADFATLYVTTAQEGMADPDAGQGVVYELRPEGARGLPAPRLIV